MNTIQTIMTIGALMIGIMLTRFLPFLLFPDSKKPPKYVLYLGRVLPAASMGLLVVFCLKAVDPLAYPYGLPELIAIAVVVALHLWRRSSLISIAGGTAVYMGLLQLFDLG